MPIYLDLVLLLPFRARQRGELSSRVQVVGMCPVWYVVVWVRRCRYESRAIVYAMELGLVVVTVECVVAEAKDLKKQKPWLRGQTRAKTHERHPKIITSASQ